jgi:hypothetical protein
MENREEVISKISKLLALANGKANEHECEAAVLAAHKLLAKYNISMEEVEAIDNEADQIDFKLFTTGNGKAWKYRLAEIISSNFRCKHFFYGRKIIAFYGYETDAKAAKEVFAFLFKMIHRLADREVHRRYARGEKPEGTYRWFVIGFLDGLKAKLDEQSKALMIVISKEVLDQYTEFSKDFRKIKTDRDHTKMDFDSEAYVNGREEGSKAMGKREIEECSNC